MESLLDVWETLQVIAVYITGIAIAVCLPNRHRAVRRVILMVITVAFILLCLSSVFWLKAPLLPIAAGVTALALLLGGLPVGIPSVIASLAVVAVVPHDGLEAAFLSSFLLAGAVGWWLHSLYRRRGMLADQPANLLLIVLIAALPYAFGAAVTFGDDVWFPMWRDALLLSAGGTGLIAVLVYPMLQRLKSSQFPDDILNAGAEAITVLSADGRIIYANHTAITMLGLPGDKIPNLSIFDSSIRGSTLSGEAFQRHNSPIRRVMETQQAERNVPIRYHTPDGRNLVLSLSLAPMVGLNRQIVCALRDVTREWEQAQTITDQKEQLDLMIAGARIGLWVADQDTGETIVNREWAKLIGYEVSELTPVTLQTWRGLIHSEDLPLIQALEWSVLAGKSDRYDCEVRMRHRDGHWVWTRTIGRMADRISDRLPRRLLGVSIDISDLKQANADLEAVSTRLESIIKAAPDSIISVSTDGHILSFNPAAEKLFQWPAEEIIGQDVSVLVPEQHRAAHAQNVELFTQRSGSEPYGMANWRTVQGRRRDGSTFPVMVTLSRTAEEDGDRIITILRDMTVIEAQRENVEKLTDELILRVREVEEANASKTRFLAMVSHELRTPLNAIIGFSDILKSGMATGKSEQALLEYYDAIHRSGQLLHSLIDDLLDLSKIEAGKFTLKPEPLSVRPIVKDVVATIGVTAKKRGISMRFTVSRAVGEVFADPRAMTQILLNLASNAVKFSPEGEGRVTIRTEPTDTGFLKFSVTDNGPGIPEHIIPTLAKPFSRAEDPMTASAPGTGLGLAISKRLAERMGGSLWIDSIVGAGTTVNVTLPIPKPGRTRPESTENAA